MIELEETAEALDHILLALIHPTGKNDHNKLKGIEGFRHRLGIVSSQFKSQLSPSDSSFRGHTRSCVLRTLASRLVVSPGLKRPHLPGFVVDNFLDFDAVTHYDADAGLINEGALVCRVLGTAA